MFPLFFFFLILILKSGKKTLYHYCDIKFGIILLLSVLIFFYVPRINLPSLFKDCKSLLQTVILAFQVYFPKLWLYFQRIWHNELAPSGGSYSFGIKKESETYPQLHLNCSFRFKLDILILFFCFFYVLCHFPEQV